LATTTQDYYTTLIRDHISPALRQLGLKGSGGTYVLPDATHWAIIGFQRSIFGDRHEQKFTINLTVVGREEWVAARSTKPYLPERPSPGTFYGNWVWGRRIGELMPSAQDHWWWFTPGTDLDSLTTEVIAMIREYGLPAMRARLAAPDDETLGDRSAAHGSLRSPA
jgi:hypothetical protein